MVLVLIAALISSAEAFVASTDCGSAPEQLSSSLPNVLLIGDSISMGTGGKDASSDPLGYGWDVQKELQEMGLAKVQHNGGWFIGGQAGPSTKGVQCIDAWLGPALSNNVSNATQYDVIHFNHGLHDIDESEYVPIGEYVHNLDTIFAKLQRAIKPGGQIIWATSSPVPWPSQYTLRNNSAAQRYNTAAGQLWHSKPAGAVVTNDLYSLITDRCGSDGPLGSYAACSLQRQWTGSPSDMPKKGSTGGVHYNARGRRYMALAVASIISRHLPTTHFANWPASHPQDEIEIVA